MKTNEVIISGARLKTSFLTVLFLFLSLPIQIMASNSFNAKLYFKFGKSDIEPSFRTNSTGIESIDSALSSADSRKIKSIYIVGSASPEGDSLFNVQLSSNRAEILANYIKTKYRSADSLFVIRTKYSGCPVVGDARNLRFAQIVLSCNAQKVVKRHTSASEGNSIANTGNDMLRILLFCLLIFALVAACYLIIKYLTKYRNMNFLQFLNKEALKFLKFLEWVLKCLLLVISICILRFWKQLLRMMYLGTKETTLGSYEPKINNLNQRGKKYPIIYNYLLLIVRRLSMSKYCQYPSIKQLNKFNEKYPHSYKDEVKSGTVLEKNLLQVMGDDAQKRANAYGGHAAHHIVEGHEGATDSQEILKKYGISINDAENGIFLPENRDSSIFNGSVHCGQHPKDYTKEANDTIKNARSRNDLVKKLNKIKKRLYNGDINLQYS